MKADLGRPYQLPRSNPDKQFFNNDNAYNIYINEQSVEVYQISRHNNPIQRLVIDKENYLNFETMLIKNGFTLGYVLNETIK